MKEVNLKLNGNRDEDLLDEVFDRMLFERNDTKEMISIVCDRSKNAYRLLSLDNGDLFLDDISKMPVSSVERKFGLRYVGHYHVQK